MPKTKITIAITLAALLVMPIATWAQSWGRVTLWVSDSDGNPIVDAVITATCDEIPDYREEVRTKKKGQATVAFGDAYKNYKLMIEKEGYLPVELPVKPDLRNTLRREITLLRPEEARAAAPPPPQPEVAAEGRLTPAETVFNEGIDLLQAGELETAKGKFEEALAADSKLAPAYSALSAVHLKQENYDAAIAAATKFLELTPDHPAGYRVLYDAYRGLGQNAEADAVLAKLTELGESGDSAILLYNDGVSALKAGQNEIAKERFEAALEADPALVPAMAAIARILFEQGDFAGSAARAEEALAIDPQDYRALLIAYEAYSNLGDTEKATAAFNELSQSDPKRVGTLFYDKGIELFNRGLAAPAADSLERALAADPSLVKAHYHLGLAYVNTGKPEKAKQHFREFLDAMPDDPDAASAAEMLKYLEN